jgi:hypothetical protein
MYEHLDRDPHHHIPPDFQERSKLWIASATNLITDDAPFIYIAVENLMFAERSLLQMEKALSRQNDKSPDPHEPFLRKECAAQSILWVFGLYEVTRVLKGLPTFSFLSDFDKKLRLLRIPLAKHEVMKAPGHSPKAHYLQS